MRLWLIPMQGQDFHSSSYLGVVARHIKMALPAIGIIALRLCANLVRGVVGKAPRHIERR